MSHGLPAQRPCRNLALPAGDADGRHRLRGRVQQSCPRAGSCGDFCALGAHGRGLSRRDAQARPRRTRPVLWRHAAADHRSVAARGGQSRPARFVHSRRLLALARSFLVQPHGARLERARRRRRGDRLRFVSDRHRRRHHRANPARLRLPVAALRPPPHDLRALGRRAACRRHGRDRLADALSQGAARSGAGRLRNFRRLRSDTRSSG